MKQKYLINKKGIAGQARNDNAWRMKKIIGTMVLLLCINAAVAQTQYRSEWHIHAGAGNATLQYQLPDFIPTNSGNVKSGIGGNLGVSYAYFFSSCFGFSLGVEGSMYNSSLTLNNLDIEHLIETPPGLLGDFRLRANYSKLEEKQSAFLLQLPLMLQLQVPLGEKAFFYLGAGGKYGLPVSATYHQSIGSMTTTGYSDYTAQVYQNMPNHGFSTYTKVRSSDKLTFGSPFLLSLETGFKWKTSDKNAIYTGIYLDYGLHNMQKESTEKLLEYNAANPTDYQYNSLLQTAIDHTPLVQEIKPFTLGIRIRMAFGSGDKIHRSGGKEKSVKPVPLLGYTP
jgi:hypothetical protein